MFGILLPESLFVVFMVNNVVEVNFCEYTEGLYTN